MKTPAVSVIMSTFREPPRLVKEAVNSILHQTWSDFEFLILQDDPGNGEIAKVLSLFKDRRIRLFRNSSNMGLAASLNRGIELSRGGLIARMDADDISYPERLDREVQAIVGKDIVWSWVDFINEEGGLMRTDTQKWESDKVLPRFPNLVRHPTVLMRREAIREVHGYRNLEAAQDLDLWMRLSDAGYKFGQVEEPLLGYRVRSGTVSSDSAAKQRLGAVYAYQLARERDKEGVDCFDVKKYLEWSHRRATKAAVRRAQFTWRLFGRTLTVKACVS